MIPKCNGDNWILDIRAMWQHLLTKGQVGMVTVMDRKVKTVLRIVCLTDMYGIGQLITM